MATQDRVQEKRGGMSERERCKCSLDCAVLVDADAYEYPLCEKCDANGCEERINKVETAPAN